ncbi:hypothetical protein NONO_c16160 [Nocardia nova SH22a]|uniref:Uncharacterized protein n=1 Tax=Nocardia nova SH22a TaxID=1415166 RepID=W5TB51_9NOCA|nr:hypothetical protein [Nocardia nova]AHH16417.1 hypothetical protein NONO_c16160 [Nocardia nova SH22a]
MSMFIDFTNTDTHTQKFQQDLVSVEENITHIGKLPQKLDDILQGDSKDGHSAASAELLRRLSAYHSSLTVLKNTIFSVAGSGGDFQVTDQAGGRKFGGVFGA